MYTARKRFTAALLAAGILVLFGVSPSKTTASSKTRKQRTRSEAPVTPAANPQGKAALDSAKSGANPVSTAEFVGYDSCADCHGPISRHFQKTSHGRAIDPRTPAATKSCETCHGPGGDHVTADEGTENNFIKRFGRGGNVRPRLENATCMQCHQRGRQMWEGSTHAAKGVTCSDCHSVHMGNPSNLKFASITQTCAQCHQRIQSDLFRTSHHPVREGKITCSDCHDPHGAIGDKNLKAATMNELCWKCHAEKRGPFLWEHGPVSEDCTTCHVPHGSNHGKLLKQRVPWLCQSCHSVSQHPGTLLAPGGAGPSEDPEDFGNRLTGTGRTGCVTCHSAIHGSNHPSGKRLTR